ncbi:hypothetical protein ACFVU3_14475 [Streptomyces sp. NPDC058052]|uniref:hypothetical protein n=1 Tax=Streptomyces sp. NPDC058052 TaxID=3346316 RepID=UPI0036EA125E
MPFVLALFLVPALLYPMARTACRQAHRLFPVHDYPRSTDPLVRTVQNVRAWTATAATCLILMTYGADQSLEEIQLHYLIRVAATPWLLLLTAPLVILVVFRLLPPSARPVLRSGLASSRRAAFWYFAAFTAVALLVPLMVFLGMGGSRPPGSPPPLSFFVLLGPMLWALTFVFFASLTLVPSVFGISRMHPGLPALVTGVLVWELAAVNLAVAGLPPGPLPLQIGTVLGGPVSVTAVAWWELRRLRTLSGVTFRATPADQQSRPA